MMRRKCNTTVDWTDGLKTMQDFKGEGEHPLKTKRPKMRKRQMGEGKKNYVKEKELGGGN